MSYTAFTVDPQSQTLVLTALTAGGSNVLIYSDSGLTTAVTLPVTITAATTYYSPTVATATLSCTSGGVSLPDVQVPLSVGGDPTVYPTPTALQLAQEQAADSGTFAPLATVGQPAAIYVSTTGSDANSGKSWASPKLTIEAAAAALPTSGGVAYGTVYVGPGTFTPASVIALSEQCSLIGAGSMQTILACNLNGDHITARMNSGSTTKPQAGQLRGFSMVGNSGASAVGIHIGDINGLEIHDVYIQDFTGTGSAGLLQDNILGHTERLLLSNVTFSNCTKGIQTITSNITTGDHSYDYQRWLDVRFKINTGQIAMSFEGTSNFLRSIVVHTCNVTGSGSTTIVWNIQDTAQVSQCTIFADMEQTSGSGAFSFSVATGAVLDIFPGSHINNAGLIFHPIAAAVFRVTPSAFGGRNVLAYSATPSISADLGRICELTLTGDVTSSSIKNGMIAQELRIVLIQDATGGHKMVWPTNIVWANGVAPAVYAPNERITVDLYYDGTNWNETSRSANAIDPPGYGLAYTVPPSAASASGGTGVASRAYYMRAFGAARAVSALLVQIAVSSGNICVGVYTNTGTGTAARPGALKATSGSVACPVAGLASISLTSTVDIEEGDWLAFVADNTTVTVARGSVIAQPNGWCYLQSSAFPLPATAGSLSTGANPLFLQNA